MHGALFYGRRAIPTFALISLAVGNSLENLSILTGFPFGHYHFTDVMGPKLFDVLIMPGLAYVGMGYLSWIVGCLILGDIENPLRGSRLLTRPMVAAFVMVYWDFSMDPIWPNLVRGWTWHDGGAYFGVPASNFFGWYVTVYPIYHGVSAAGNLVVRRPPGLSAIVDAAGTQWKATDILSASTLPSIFMMGAFAFIAWVRICRWHSRSRFMRGKMNQAPVIVITGGSCGIGAATAKLAAAKGYAVCVNYRNDADAADQVVQRIAGEGGHAIAVRGDISSERDVVEIFRQVDSKLGRLSALVNNAGILAPQARLDSMGADRIMRIAVGSMICAREAVRRMSTRFGGTGGGIVNLSSGAAKYGAPAEYADYAASKGAIDTFTLGLAKEVAEEGIRVNAVRPGFIYTDLHAKGGEPRRVDRVKTLVPMQRGGQPEEVARAVLWLLSEEASCITGTIIDVAGGR